MMGSPPHTRGTRNIHFWVFRRAGITPAYAGNTLFELGKITANEDHPRIRGEHFSSQ